MKNCNYNLARPDATRSRYNCSSMRCCQCHRRSARLEALEALSQSARYLRLPASLPGRACDATLTWAAMLGLAAGISLIHKLALNVRDTSIKQHYTVYTAAAH